MNAIEIEMSDDDLEKELNDLYGSVDVCGMTMNAGYVLREMDPIAFRCAKLDKDSQYMCSECDTVYDSEEMAEECCMENESDQ